MKTSAKLQKIYNLGSDTSSARGVVKPGKGHITGNGGNGREQSNDWVSIEFERSGILEFRVKDGRGHVTGQGGNGLVVKGGKGHVVGQGGNGLVVKGGKGHVVGTGGNG